MTREELNNQIAELKESLVARDAAVDESEARIEALAAEHAKAFAEVVEARDNAIANAERLQIEANDLTAELADVKEQVAEATAERDKFKAVAKNPAMMDAAMVAAATGSTVGDAEADELDRKAAESEKQPTMWEQYNALEGAARTAFWRENKAALQSEMKQG